MARDEADSDPESVDAQERLRSMEARMRRLSETRRSHNESARANADKRDGVQTQYGELREEIKSILDEQKEVRIKAKVHQARRDAIQEQLRNLFSRSKQTKSNQEKSVILQLSENRDLAEKLEKRLEIDGTLSLDAENKIHRQLKNIHSKIKELEPQVQEELRIKIDLDDLEGSIEQLKLEADDEHKQMVALHEEADKIWENVKPKFEERDFLKAEGDRLHNLFVQSREDANAVHKEIEELHSQVTEVRGELKAIRDERASWITLHNKSVEESLSTPKESEELANSLVSNLMGSGAIALGGTAGSQSTQGKKKARRSGRKVTAARRGNRGRTKKPE